MFVDVGKNRPFLDQLPFSFVRTSHHAAALTVFFTIVYFSSLSILQKLGEVREEPFADTVGYSVQDKGDITALTKVENKYFPEIRHWIEGFLYNRKVSFNQGWQTNWSGN